MQYCPGSVWYLQLEGIMDHIPTEQIQIYYNYMYMPVITQSFIKTYVLHKTRSNCIYIGNIYVILLSSTFDFFFFPHVSTNQKGMHKLANIR